MAYAPIALIIPQYEDYPNNWLKAYEQGGVTPLPMATDATGGTTAAKFELDAQGFPITAGNARLIPFINGDYDLWLFPNEADADANDTTNAIQVADNLNAFAGGIENSLVLSNKAAAAALALTSSDAGKKIFIVSTDGGQFTVRYDVTAPYADDSVSYCGTQFIPSGGDGTVGIVRDDVSAINAKWFGALGVAGNDDYSALTEYFGSISQWTKYETTKKQDFLLPFGEFPVSQKLIINRNYINIIGEGVIVPFGAYSDYLVQISFDGITNERALGNSLANISTENFVLDCKGQSRGIEYINVDNSPQAGLKIYRPYGTAIKCRTAREFSFINPIIQQGHNRQIFDGSAVSDWNAGTAYSVGDRARKVSAAYNAGTTYIKGNIVRSGSDDYIASEETTGDAPSSNPLIWQFVHPEYYEALIASTNKDPESFPATDASSVNRIWKWVLENEPCIDLSADDENSDDANNNLILNDPIFHECEHQEYIYIDHTFGSPVGNIPRRITIYSSHLHQLSDNYVTNYGSLVTPAQVKRNRTRAVMLGSCFAIGFIDTNFRFAPDGTESRGLYIGAMDSNKVASEISVDTASRFSSDGDNAVGVMVLQGTVNDQIRLMSPSFKLTKTLTSINVVDYADALRATTYTPQYHLFDLSGGDIFIGAPQISAVGVRQEGDTRNRIEQRSNGRIYFGDGSNAPTEAIGGSSTIAALAAYLGTRTELVTTVGIATPAELADKTSEINTEGKHIGRQVFDSTNLYVLVSEGTTDVAVWRNISTGAVVVTPV